MTNFKKTCSVHRFNYTGDKCPFCEKERIDNMARRFYKTPVKKDEKSTEITQSDLEKLKAKFNTKI